MRRSLLDGPTSAWLRQFGGFDFSTPNTIDVKWGSPVNGLKWGSPVSRLSFHAEARYDRVLGADFAYSATITADWTQPDLSAHLQFRISDEGRYGVRLQAGTIALYRFMLGDRTCSDDPAVIAHCPLWPQPNFVEPQLDDTPIAVPLGPFGNFDPALRALTVTVVAEESRFGVSFGTPRQNLGHLEVEDIENGIGIGRFGVYVLASAMLFDVRFSDIAATTDPTAKSNFVLLYSTPGYDADGTKRALVRTVNDIDADDYDDASSSFTVTNTLGVVKIPARRFERSGPIRLRAGFRRTLGFQFLAADFTDLREAGLYTLEARLATSNGLRVLRSAPFEITPRLVTQRILWPLSILNAKARRAAEEDFRRNWFIESGRAAWSVGLDGAFIADRADDQRGALLKRIFDTGNWTLSEKNFRLVASVTIVRGCDAQLQFRITDDERWAVTLQAGDAGGCPHGTGPGAIRLHREGLAVHGADHFEAVASHGLEGNPFEVGRAYDVEVRAYENQIAVLLDGKRVIEFNGAVNPQQGGFALKAWASTVRFEHFAVWARNVGLSRPTPGVWIPFDPASNLSSQGFNITTPDSDYRPVGFLARGAMSPTPQEISTPKAAQQHGFHDCNSFIGEITSHSVFLSSLLDVWVTRADAATPSEQEDLRWAIITAVLYLNELYEQGNRSGAFAHQEPGRAALGLCDKILTSRFAMYGLSAFAEKGDAVDKNLARGSFDRAEEAWRWLDENHGRDPVFDSIVAIRMARAAQRQGLAAGHWFDRANSNATDVLNTFGKADIPVKPGPILPKKPDPIAAQFRPTLRSIPWFEGVYETFFRWPFVLTDERRERVQSIAEQLETVMKDSANGFCIIPQASDDRTQQDQTLPVRNWTNLSDLPLAVYAIPKPSSVGDWYLSEHFATAAADCVYIGRLAPRKSLERLATSNLYWIFGLNPGIPVTKVVSQAPSDGPWSAASFIYNGPATFARSIEGNRVQNNAGKGWLAPWEESPSSRHRETWAIDPANNGFQSIVNGHVLREDQWHYWSVGTAGWVSAETFMLIDASFLKASLALEDWHSGSTVVRATPYDVTKTHFFDTTHLDRASTLWRFDDPDHTASAEASRMATDFASSKGFSGARLTGHHIGERVGVLCLPVTGTTFADVETNAISKLRFAFRDINNTHWAQVARAAMEIAASRQFAAGFFTGHQIPGRCGWIGIDANLVAVFDIDDCTVQQSQWAFDDINTVDWAQAARLATDICIQSGFAGGFFTGHQLPNKRQIVALRMS